MRLAFISALSLVASVSNLPAQIDYTITPENDGQSSRFSWSASGIATTTGIAWHPMAPSPYSIGGIDIGTTTADTTPIFAGSLSTLPASFRSFGVNPYPISTGFSLTNETKGTSITFDSIWFMAAGNTHLIVLDTQDAVSFYTNDIYKYTGTINGHVILPIAFSFFNPGVYSSNSVAGMNTLTIGTPVPEPSTYGLILGGLALAGAAVRRRRQKAA